MGSSALRPEYPRRSGRRGLGSPVLGKPPYRRGPCALSMGRREVGSSQGGARCDLRSPLRSRPGGCRLHPRCIPDREEEGYGAVRDVQDEGDDPNPLRPIRWDGDQRTGARVSCRVEMRHDIGGRS